MTQFDYDDRGRIVKATNALGEENHYTCTDANLVQIEVGRTEAGSLVSIAGFRYGSEGAPLSATDGESRTTGYGYDPLGRLIRITDPLSGNRGPGTGLAL